MVIQQIAQLGGDKYLLQTPPNPDCDIEKWAFFFFWGGECWNFVWQSILYLRQAGAIIPQRNSEHENKQQNVLDKRYDAYKLRIVQALGQKMFIYFGEREREIYVYDAWCVVALTYIIYSASKLQTTAFQRVMRCHARGHATRADEAVSFAYLNAQIVANNKVIYGVGGRPTALSQFLLCYWANSSAQLSFQNSALTR